VSSVDQVFREFVSSFQSGASTHPRDYLGRLQGVDREELRTRIAAFLEKAPSRSWDPGAFEGSISERAVSRALSDIDPAGEAAEPWPQLLPALRERARLKRATVVERLAAGLGFPESEDRVAVYYHRMEQGQLAPRGVSNRVLGALGSILDVSAERLRAAGAAGEAQAAGGGEVFARRGSPAEGMDSPGIRSVGELAQPDRGESPDELDRLFIGGE
jgi:hypothetical protein